MNNDYQILKKESLKTYENFNYIMKKFYDENAVNGLEIKLDFEKEEFKKQLIELNTFTERLKNNNFKLMVIGASKSGKSTFINNYLGAVDLLPTDVLQCTSSIIRIKNGPKLKLNITYADDTKKSFENENDIKCILKNSGSLNGNEEKYKYIPTAVINNEVFLKKRDNKILDSEIEEIIKKLKKEKITSMSEKEYKELITEYIRKYQYRWKTLVKEMVIEYPFESEEMKEIEIIDSPGVEAIGGLADITRDYAKKVNAIMFLQSVDAPVENYNLKELIENYSIYKGTSFLVITKSCLLTENDLDKKLKELHKFYNTVIDEKQIIAIDSKLYESASYIEKNFSDKTYKELKNYLKESKNVERAVKEKIFEVDDIKEGIENLKKESNFKVLKESLNTFGRKSHYLELKGFLEKNLIFLKSIIAKLEHNISVFGIKDPQEYEIKIEKLIKEIEEINVKLNTSIQKYSNQYIDKLGKEIDKKLNYIESEIKKINDSNELKNFSFKEIEMFKKFQEEIIEKLIEDLNKYLILNKNNKKFEYLTPNFTSADFEEIEKNAEKNAEEIEYIETGWTFTKSEQKIVFNENKYLAIIRDSILERFEDIKNKTRYYLLRYIDETIHRYEVLLKNNLEERKNELKDYKKLAEENEKRIDIRNYLTKYKSSFEDIEEYMKKIRDKI